MKKQRLIHQLLPLTLAAAAFFLNQAARADSLADRAPADAVGFISWAGADALGEPYKASHLKGLIDTFDIPALIAKQAAMADPNQQARREDAEALAKAFFAAPTALYFGPVDFANIDKPGLKIAIYSKVGKDAATALAAKINAEIEKKKDDKAPPSAASVAGDFLLITIGNLPDFDKRLSGDAPADGLANVPAFQQTMTQVDAATKPSAVLFYLNAEAAIKLISDGVDAKGGFGATMWPNIADMIGLNSLRHCAFAGNFDGANWTSQSFVGLDAKRNGLMAMLDNKRLPDDIIKLIPKTAAWASVNRLDAPRLFQDIKDGTAKIDPVSGPRNFDTGMQQFFAFTGVDFQKDIVETLGDSFILYGIPNAKGESFKNAVLVNKPKDPAKLETAITTIESVVSAMIAQRGVDSVTFKTENLPAPNDKVSVHVISSERISPAWTVQDGVLYVSTSVAGIQAAIESAGKNSPIFDNAQFTDAWKKVGNKEMSSFSFVDYQKVAPELHATLTKALADYKASHPDDKNSFVLPPLDKITTDLGTVLTVAFTDKDGYHTKSTGPLPMLEMLRPESLLQIALMLQYRTPVEKDMP